jgi:tight adherence protein B
MFPLLLSLLVAVIAAGTVWFFVDVFVKAGSDYRERFKESAQRSLSTLFLFIEADRLFVMNVLFIIATFSVSLILFGNLYVSLALAVAAAASPPLIYRVLRRRYMDRAIEQLPDTLMSLGSGMRSGQSLQQALEAVVTLDKGPLAQELILFLRELRVGVGFNEALDNLYARVPRSEIQLMGAAMKIARETGSNLAETIERLANTLRSKMQMEGKIRSLTSQGKLQGIIMAGLPLVIGLALFKMEPRAMSYMFTTWYGWLVVGVILTFDIVGYVIIRKIIDIDV